ncbi:hypothetical protein BGZ59_004635 [Podila verticillata]|nr:hypothetical protein BGZ59_004635 [Podila verticillata]
MASSSTQLSLLDVVNQCDNYPLSDSKDPANQARLAPLTFHDFMVDGIPVGRIHCTIVPHMAAYNESAAPTFHITDTAVAFMPWMNDYNSRSDAIAQMLEQWRKDEATFPVLKGWRNELYGIYTHITDPTTTKQGAALAIERAAWGLFGFQAYAIYINGYVYSGQGSSPREDLQLWISRRSLTKPIYPGLLDNMVAGGIEFGHSPWHTVIKESMEEASLPKEVAQRAKSVGTISYTTLFKNGKETQTETQLMYDLELPLGLTPMPCDSEVEDFRLWTIDKVLTAIRAGEFKPNCACACLHFMIRHGVLTPENEPDYFEIDQRLHRRIEYPGPKKWPTFNEGH